MAPARSAIAAADWWSAGLKLWTLGFEVGAVVALRTARLAAGGALAQREAGRMVFEKAQALTELQMKAATGALGLEPAVQAQRTLNHYRARVRANRRRLSRG